MRTLQWVSLRQHTHIHSAHCSDLPLGAEAHISVLTNRPCTGYKSYPFPSGIFLSWCKICMIVCMCTYFLYIFSTNISRLCRKTREQHDLPTRSGPTKHVLLLIGTYNAKLFWGHSLLGLFYITRICLTVHYIQIRQ